MTDIKIVKVEANQVYQLQEICRNTFFETFSSSNSEENMTKYLEEGFSIPKLTTELNNLNSEFYFALYEHKPIGYLKVNFGESQTEQSIEHALEIERIYVLNEFHGKKVGQLLFEKAKKIAISKKLNHLWLGVWEHNTRALQFYKKNGFMEFGQHVFVLGDDKQTDILMKLDLSKQ